MMLSIAVSCSAKILFINGYFTYFGERKELIGREIKIPKAIQANVIIIFDLWKQALLFLLVVCLKPMVKAKVTIRYSLDTHSTRTVQYVHCTV